MTSLDQTEPSTHLTLTRSALGDRVIAKQHGSKQDFSLHREVTTLRNIDLVRGSIASSLAICRVSISVVVDDVAALVDFQHGLEFGVGDNVHGGRQRVTEMQLYAKVAPLH